MIVAVGARATSVSLLRANINGQLTALLINLAQLFCIQDATTAMFF